MSIFLPKEGDRFKVSLAAIEFYSSGISVDTTDEEVWARAYQTLVEFCGVQDPEEEDYAHLTHKINEGENTSPRVAEDAGPSKRSFLTEYLEFINSIPPDLLLLMATNYDYAAARELYYGLDKLDALQVILMYKQQCVELAGVWFECTLYGTGNKYSNNANQVRLCSDEGLNRLKSLGFLS